MRTILALVAVAVAALPEIALAQGGKANVLPPADYIEIQQLYARRAFAIDQGDGQTFASLFTPDGQYSDARRVVKGTKDLTALIRGPIKAATAPRHFVSNILLAATPEGAHGRRAYIANINFPGKTLNQGGLYDDVIVKTADGWRFTDWKYIQDVPAEAPTAAPAK